MNTTKLLKSAAISMMLYFTLIMSVSNAVELKAANETSVSDKQIDLWIENSKSGSTVEFIGNDKTVGLQFEINIPEETLKAKSYSCGISVPSTHTATCTNVNGILRVIVFSMTNAILDSATVLSFEQAESSYQFRKSDSLIKLSNILVGGQGGANLTPDYLK